jgi:sulfotransferase family protein
MSKCKIPNFFIIGAPKCGTTALSNYLSEHDNIVMSELKEPHYFALDMPKFRTAVNENHYLNYFKNVTCNTLAVGEASVWYLYSKVALKKIHKFNPNSKIIIMLRRPDEMVYSMHAQNIHSTDEDVFDFKVAWHLSSIRENGDSIPRNCRAKETLVYTKIAMYSEQLLRVHKYFPREQVKIILFDDFKLDTGKCYRDVLSFLEVPYDNRIEFPIVNENTVSKYLFIKKYIKQPPVKIKNILDLLKIKLNIKHLGVALLFDKLCSKSRERVNLDQELKLSVMKNYRSDIQKLSKLIKIDLNHWLEL